jgi:hypothetical protein
MLSFFEIFHTILMERLLFGDKYPENSIKDLNWPTRILFSTSSRFMLDILD